MVDRWRLDAEYSLAGGEMLDPADREMRAIQKEAYEAMLTTFDEVVVW